MDSLPTLTNTLGGGGGNGSICIGQGRAAFDGFCRRSLNVVSATFTRQIQGWWRGCRASITDYSRGVEEVCNCRRAIYSFYRRERFSESSERRRSGVGAPVRVATCRVYETLHVGRDERGAARVFACA